MYYHGKPVEDKTSLQEPNAQRPQAQRRPSVYNQRAKGGFKFWLERDPMVTKIPRKNSVFNCTVNRMNASIFRDLCSRVMF